MLGLFCPNGESMPESPPALKTKYFDTPPPPPPKKKGRQNFSRVCRILARISPNICPNYYIGKIGGGGGAGTVTPASPPPPPPFHTHMITGAFVIISIRTPDFKGPHCHTLYSSRVPFKCILNYKDKQVQSLCSVVSSQKVSRHTVTRNRYNHIVNVYNNSVCLVNNKMSVGA